MCSLLLSLPVTTRGKPCKLVHTCNRELPAAQPLTGADAGYQFNRDDAWTKMHDWGCYNWNMVGKMHRRQDSKQKDTKFF
jgi:hypothetical protein